MKESVVVLFTALFVDKSIKEVNGSLIKALKEIANTNAITIICNMEDKELLEEIEDEFGLGDITKDYFWRNDKDSEIETFMDSIFVISSIYTSSRLVKLIDSLDGKILIHNPKDTYDENGLRKMFNNYPIRVNIFNEWQYNSVELYELISNELSYLEECKNY